MTNDKPKPSGNLDSSPGYSPYESAAEDAAPEAPRGRPYFALGIGGAAGGILGALLGNVAVVGVFHLNPKAGEWFKGPYGPPFFSLALSTAVYYALLGAGLFRGWGRPKGFALGLAAALVSFLMPMAVATRSLSDQMLASVPAFSWVYLVLGLYVGAGAFSLWVLGAFCGAGDEWLDWRAGSGALAGAALSYMCLQILTVVFPALHPAAVPPGWLPHRAVLLDGLVSGALTGVAISFTTAVRSDPEPVEEHI